MSTSDQHEEPRTTCQPLIHLPALGFAVFFRFAEVMTQGEMTEQLWFVVEKGSPEPQCTEGMAMGTRVPPTESSGLVMEEQTKQGACSILSHAKNVVLGASGRKVPACSFGAERQVSCGRFVNLGVV